MSRVLAILVMITVLAAAAAHFSYQELEKRLLASSCLPLPPVVPNKLTEDSTASAKEPEHAPAAQDFQIIVSRDIFRSNPVGQGQQEEKPNAEQPPVEEVLPTTLNLTLAGTVLSSGQTSRAIIINNTGRDQKQQLLQIGDGVQGTAAVIKDISWESVTLEVNGKQEVLSIPKPKSAPGFSPQARLAPPDPVMPEPPPLAEEIQGSRPPVRSNRRINLPQEEPTVVEEEPPPDEEIPLPELPEEPELEESQAELPPLDAE